MYKKKLIIAGIAAGFSVTLLASTEDKNSKSSESKTMAAKGECHGVNACKGKGECGSKEGNSCAGTNSCKGKGWIAMTKEQCKKKKGKFVEEMGHKS